MNTHKEPARGIPVPHRSLYRTDEEYQYAKEKYKMKLDNQWAVEPKEEPEIVIESKDGHSWMCECSRCLPTPPSQIEENTRFVENFESDDNDYDMLTIKQLKILENYHTRQLKVIEGKLEDSVNNTK